MAHTNATREEHPFMPRALHVAHLIAMFVLIFTGFYISDPFFYGGMGVMRGGHLFFMWVLLITALWRVVWAFVGKTAPLGQREPVRDYKHFGWQKENRGTLGPTIAYYTFFRRDAPPVYKYNGLQKGTYVVWLLLIVAQAITGFALWQPTAKYLSGLQYALGGPIYVRTIHYVIMWLFILTTALHIYLSSLHRDELKLMFTGHEWDEGAGAPPRGGVPGSVEPASMNSSTIT